MASGAISLLRVLHWPGRIFHTQGGSMVQKPARPNSSVRSKSGLGGDVQTHLDVVEGFQRGGRTHLVAASPCLG